MHDDRIDGTRQESILFQTLYIHLVNHTDIRQADTSLFFRKNCLGIYSSQCVYLKHPIHRRAKPITMPLAPSAGAKPHQPNQSIYSSPTRKHAICGSHCLDLILSPKSTVIGCTRKTAARIGCGVKSRSSSFRRVTWETRSPWIAT